MKTVGLHSRINVYTGRRIYLRQLEDGSKEHISKSTFNRLKKQLLSNINQ